MHCHAQNSTSLYHESAIDVMKMSLKHEVVLVGDYMSTTMITINQENSMLDASRKMAERNVSSLAVTDERGRIAGILTERDIVRAVTKHVPPSEVEVSSLMTRPVMSISKDAMIEDAAGIMSRNKIRHLVVRDPLGHEAVGIITITDLGRYLRQTAREQDVDSEVWETVLLESERRPLSSRQSPRYIVDKYQQYGGLGKMGGECQERRCSAP